MNTKIKQDFAHPLTIERVKTELALKGVLTTLKTAVVQVVRTKQDIRITAYCLQEKSARKNIEWIYHFQSVPQTEKSTYGKYHLIFQFHCYCTRKLKYLGDVS